MELKRKIEMTFNWWNDDDKDVEPDIQEQLENHAEERIIEMRKEGYTSGELNTEIGDETYRGWWTFGYVSVEEPEAEPTIKDVLKFIQDKFTEKDRSYSVEELVNYYRIKMNHYGQTSVYAFVSLKDFSNKNLGEVKKGDIFKPAGWSQPAKHARGSMLDKTTWDKCFTQYGVVYLR